MNYIKIGVFGAKDFKNAVKICVHSSRDRACARNCKNMCKIHVVYRFICFCGQEFQKCNQNYHTLAQGLCTCKKIAKICAKYMLYIDLYVFGAKNFKNATKNSAKFNQLIKKSKFYWKHTILYNQQLLWLCSHTFQAFFSDHSLY